MTTPTSIAMSRRCLPKTKPAPPGSNWAKAYLDIGDLDGARSMLEEVVAEGGPSAQAEAGRSSRKLAEAWPLRSRIEYDGSDFLGCSGTQRTASRRRSRKRWASWRLPRSRSSARAARRRRARCCQVIHFDATRCGRTAWVLGSNTRLPIVRILWCREWPRISTPLFGRARGYRYPIIIAPFAGDATRIPQLGAPAA